MYLISYLDSEMNFDLRQSLIRPSSYALSTLNGDEESLTSVSTYIKYLIPIITGAEKLKTVTVELGYWKFLERQYCISINRLFPLSEFIYA